MNGKDIPGNCWEWDGYIGECTKWHPPQWWQYMNAYSISAVLILVAVLVVAVAFTLAKIKVR